MADGVNEPQPIIRAADEHAAEAPLPAAVGFGRSRPRRSSTSPHSHKFLAATAALAGIAIGALAVALAILFSAHSSGPQASWSSWKPPDSGLAGEREIANEVAPFYRASPAVQLAIVTVQNIPDATSSSASSSTSNGGGTELAVRDQTTGSLSAIPGTSAIYTLCGLGSNCSIASGTPSTARLLLLRREALELALYTFKYLGNVDNVVAILPPGHTTATAKLTPNPPSPGKTATPSQIDLAVVFQRQGLQHFLDRPLRQTLPEQLPPSVTEMPNAPEAELVSVITSQALFRQQLIQSQDGSSVIVLDPQPAQ